MTTGLSLSSSIVLSAEWLHRYNWKRPHRVHNEKNPVEQYCELTDQTPLTGEMADEQHPARENTQQ